jgi:hypothetical protein
MSLMSEQSRQALADAFFRAAKSGLLRAPEDSIEIQPIEGGVSKGPAAGQPMNGAMNKAVNLAARTKSVEPPRDVLVITTSSFSFRLLTMFDVAPTPEARAYFGGAPDAKIETAFAEIANLCCGALNRELSSHFPHLGMSIPYSLSSHCLGCLDELKPEYVSRYAITVNGSVRLEATLCMCCSAPVEVIARAEAAAETTGELELF